MCSWSVYVTDHKNHNILVFTTEGAYVTSFGQNDDDPVGICIDKNGFVFVYDNSSSRIQIF